MIKDGRLEEGSVTFKVSSVDPHPYARSIVGALAVIETKSRNHAHYTVSCKR